MDPPPLPLPPHPPTNTDPTASSITATIATQSNYPDSTGSSPRSRQPDTLDDSLPSVPGAKLRIMCSYGGHIIPRPHDKSLCYVGGETRMVALDRDSSLSSLSSRLSQSLLSSRHFTLKYQLPNEDLDSLISVTTDEDLENMIEEYDRITSTSPLKPARLRLFLFLAKPETAASMGSLLDDAKSETWFVDALNGSGLLPRGLSDSAVDCLREFDNGVVHSESSADLEAQNNFPNNNKQAKNVQDVQSMMPDSPMVETSSSFGSSSSSPSMSNLPPIKVRVEDSGSKLQNQMAGLDEHFSQMGVGTVAQKQQDGSVLLSFPPQMPTIFATSTPVSAIYTEHGNRILSDDERSDQGLPTGFRKPPLPIQPVQRKLVDGYNLPSPDSKLAGGFNLPSPDSVASDSSIASATSLSKHAEPTHNPPSENRVPTTAPTANTQDSNSQIQVQQLHDPTYFPLPQQIQQQQQQFIHPNTQYIHHPATGQVPMSSYYQLYAPPPQQQLHHQMDQHYPMYVLPVTQNQVSQPYAYPTQATIADSTVMASSRPPQGPPPNPTTPSIYPTMSTTPNRSEMTGNIYTTATHFQQQYTGVPQMQHPSQSFQANTAAPGVNYGFEYSNPTNEQLYYNQHPVGQLPPQYHTMTPATAVMLAQASAPLPAENTTQ